MVEFGETERGRVDATKAEVFAFKRGGGVDVGADVAGFRAKEDVEDEFDGVGLIMLVGWK